MEFEFIAGLRKNSRLLWLKDDNQLFVLNRKNEKKNKKYYVCYEKECKVRVCLKNNLCVHLNENKTHNHGDQIQFIHQLAVKNRIKEKCASTPTSSHRDIFIDEIVKYV